MEQFKKIILPMQGHSKSSLHWLYNTEHTNIADKEYPPKIFNYEQLKFRFSGTGYRTSEKLLMYVSIPCLLLGINDVYSNVAIETYLLRMIEPIINNLSESYKNNDKNIREKAQFGVQSAGCTMLKRSGIAYCADENAYLLRLNFNVPLVNALSVNAKSAIRAVKDIMFNINEALANIDRTELKRYIKTYLYQQEIRSYMREHNLCAFIANGSILPRENGTDEPMKNAIPFKSPDELLVKIVLSDGRVMEGMGIPNGITVITGGGYSGKSTLLNSIETGIYNHIPGDGREYVLSDLTALKTNVEDGRPISNLDISPFFKHLPGKNIDDFSTTHASGSISQAANIIESVCGKCRLLLIDEDKSATNFMIRDKNMRLVVKNEPIIPFTDRVRELYCKKNVSTILVIGGSSEYLSYADTVILMEDYLPHIITEDIQTLDLPEATHNETSANWASSRRLVPKETSKAIICFRSVETENEKKIILDKYSADITHLTALISGNQLNTLARIMECLLTDKEADNAELLEKVERCTEKMLNENDTYSLVRESTQRFYEEIRPIDAFCCVNRMRGLYFRSEGRDANE